MARRTMNCWREGQTADCRLSGRPTETECGFHIFNALAHSSHEYTTACVSAHTPPPPSPDGRCGRACATHAHTLTHMRPFIRAPNRSPAALATAIDRKLPSPPRRLLLLLRHSRNKKSAKFPSPDRATTTTGCCYYYY
ncbi:unnamed protein product [Aphis gossypii]|uniref:Uncharacterized protein n=1 Tax=Aphis gossypii TaxID=80765 RepID=A0A9P0IX58_APHGO|nr:unnamed protein product [Aphis gossypii]